MRYRKNCSGFTLVELVVVVAILAILMAMAVPQMIGYTKASHRMAGRTEAYHAWMRYSVIWMMKRKRERCQREKS